MRTFQQGEIKFVALRDAVDVDGAPSTHWDAHMDGVEEIHYLAEGVLITWGFGATFTPWSNVIYADIQYHHGSIPVDLTTARR